MPEFRDLFDTSLRCLTPPTDEPLELDRAKSHCNIPLDLADFDLDLTDWISAAREQVETDSERSLMPQTWELTLDRFPQARSIYAGNLSWPDWNTGVIELHRPPVTSVEVEYVNTDGDTVTLIENTDYLVNLAAEPAIIAPVPGKIWPTMTPQPRGVVVTFQSGYANAASVPRTALQAMRMLIAHWFRTREAAGERPTKDHDRAYAALINSLKWRP